MPSLFDETKSSVFLGRRDDLPTLINRLDRIGLDGREQIQVCVVASKHPILEVLRERQVVSSQKIRLTELEPHSTANTVGAFSLARYFGLKERKSVSGDFLVVPTARDNMSLLIFIESIAFWHEGLSPFLDSTYPRLVRPFFTQGEMHEFIRNVQNALPSHRVRVLRTSSRERLRSGDARKKYASSLRWTDSDADSVFREARASNTWFRSVYFELVFLKDDKLISEKTFGTVSKYGYFACTDKFSLFYNAIVERMVDFGHSRLKFLQGRSRNQGTNFTPKPVKIEYDSEVFSSPAQIAKLLDALKKFKHGSCSVLHGNPYLHVSMLDNYDYSAADVWVLNKNEVLIVPQIRTSDAALKRIINHIYEYFREGKLGEFSSQGGI